MITRVIALVAIGLCVTTAGRVFYLGNNDPLTVGDFFDAIVDFGR